MNILRWLRSHTSPRGRALRLYRQGMAQAKAHNPKAAIDSYSKAVGTKRAPADVKAMALYNRALVLASIGETRKAIADLNEVLSTPGTDTDVKMEARRRLLRMQRRSGKPTEDRASR